MEIGEAYALTRKNDIFSGLGERDGGRPPPQPTPAKEEQKGKEEEEEFVRVEEILETIDEETATGGGDGEETKHPHATEPADGAKQMESEEELLSQELKRAECIVETFRDVKVQCLG
jgi:hypothetical protein